MTEAPHIPVLLDEVISALQPKDGHRLIDGTFGAGGYTRAILGAADCAVLAIDQDPDAIANGQPLVDEMKGRLTLAHGRFSNLVELAHTHGFAPVDGIALDIGVSSMQLDQALRGFSFQTEGPLDMRMAQAGESAADIVNGADESLLADIFFAYGEERKARRIARAITRARAEGPIETTKALTDIIISAAGPVRGDKIHPATRSFQGLRIYVNDELGELARALLGAEEVLKPGGVLAVVSFHSLEDRIVKRFLKLCSETESSGSRYLPDMPADTAAPSFEIISRKPIVAGDEECARNPRARSAKLRAARRCDAPARAPAMEDFAAPYPLDETRQGKGRARA